MREPDDSQETPPRFDQLVEPILYGDIFDFPLTAEELHRYCRVEISRAALLAAIATDAEFNRSVVVTRGYYHLRGREALVALREQRARHSDDAWRTARRVAWLVGHVPFVKGILVSGSLANDNARRRDDLDFLVMVETDRIWLVFFILGTLQRIVSRRYLCPNYYVAERHLRLTRDGYYVAREAAQAKPIFGAGLCRRFKDENRWIEAVFPNLRHAAPLEAPSGGILERGRLLGRVSAAAERALRARPGDAIERVLARVLKSRLVEHYRAHDQQVPPEVLENALAERELRFHGLGHESRIFAALEERKERVAR